MKHYTSYMLRLVYGSHSWYIKIAKYNMLIYHWLDMNDNSDYIQKNRSNILKNTILKTVQWFSTETIIFIYYIMCDIIFTLFVRIYTIKLNDRCYKIIGN